MRVEVELRVFNEDGFLRREFNLGGLVADGDAESATQVLGDRLATLGGLTARVYSREEELRRHARRDALPKYVRGCIERGVMLVATLTRSDREGWNREAIAWHEEAQSVLAMASRNDADRFGGCSGGVGNTPPPMCATGRNDPERLRTELERLREVICSPRGQVDVPHSYLAGALYALAWACGDASAPEAPSTRVSGHGA